MYVCDVCHVVYDMPSEAEMCERRHENRDEHKAEDERTCSVAEINTLIREYVQKYGENPPIDVRLVLWKRVNGDTVIL